MLSMNQEIKISKKMSYLLRHNPENLKMDENGYVEVSELLEKLDANYKHLDITFEDIEQVVVNNDKQRFKFNEDKTKIKANQGHTIKITHDFKEKTPPEFLFHGTPDKSVNIILESGIKKMSRHHVHLSGDTRTANIVGARRGKHTVLVVEALKMHNDGYKFYISDNNVWFTDFVPSKYIRVE